VTIPNLSVKVDILPVSIHTAQELELPALEVCSCGSNASGIGHVHWER